MISFVQNLKFLPGMFCHLVLVSDSQLASVMFETDFILFRLDVWNETCICYFIWLVLALETTLCVFINLQYITASVDDDKATCQYNVWNWLYFVQAWCSKQNKHLFETKQAWCFKQNMHILSCFIQFRSILLISCVFWILQYSSRK